MNPGALVLYAKDPLLFGRMLVITKNTNLFTGRVALECEAVHADTEGNFPRDWFSADELRFCVPAVLTA